MYIEDLAVFVHVDIRSINASSVGRTIYHENGPHVHVDRTESAQNTLCSKRTVYRSQGGADSTALRPTHITFYVQTHHLNRKAGRPRGGGGGTTFHYWPRNINIIQGKEQCGVPFDNFTQIIQTSIDTVSKSDLNTTKPWHDCIILNFTTLWSITLTVHVIKLFLHFLYCRYRLHLSHVEFGFSLVKLPS